MTFSELEDIYKKHLFLDLEHDFVKVIFASIIANRMTGMHPFWLNIVGPPSSGKSEMLESLEGLPEIEPIDLLNANSLMSGLKKGKNTDDKEPSLLPKLDGKIMIIKDSSTFYSMNQIERSYIFAQLRQAFDGTLTKVTGVTHKSFSAKFGIFMGSTPRSEYDSAIDAALGQRFVIFRLSAISDDSDKWKKVKSRINTMNKSKIEIRDATEDFLKKLDKPEPLWDNLFEKYVPRLCELLEDLRTLPVRDRYSKQIDGIISDNRNEPIRLAKQLCSLYSSLVYITHKKNDAINIIYRVIENNIPPIRLKIIKIVKKNRGLTERELAEILGTSDTTVHRTLEEMRLLKIILYDVVYPVYEDDKKYRRVPFRLNPKYNDIFKVLPNI
jgi:hypothetical protein